VRHTVKLPRLGDTADDVVVVEWLKSVGEHVVAKEAVLVVETSKVTTEVVSPVAGTVRELLVDTDDEVAVGTPIMIVDGN
jgi:pyruvate/2-oxoglutarate dehydrogenase complex dihydrolipoamide acyltransferase (E2) component